MDGYCKLYGTFGELRQSHIFPKFVIDHMKKTGSPYLRFLGEPNKRSQDGLKIPLLSHEAEQAFGAREKWFSEKIFKPYLINKKLSLPYDENLYYFAISFLWRTLILELEAGGNEDAWFYQDLKRTEEEWRGFLKEFKYPFLSDRIYIHFTDNVIDHNLSHGGADYYFTRMLDATVVKNDTTEEFLAVYGKFMRFIFWGIIRGGDDNDLVDLKINPTGGVFDLPQLTSSKNLGGFYLNRIEEIDSLPKASDKQQEIIIAEMNKDRQAFLKSDAAQTMINDRIIEKRNNNDL